jgi:hypothetical protein
LASRVEQVKVKQVVHRLPIILMPEWREEGQALDGALPLTILLRNITAETPLKTSA